MLIDDCTNALFVLPVRPHDGDAASFSLLEKPCDYNATKLRKERHVSLDKDEVRGEQRNAFLRQWRQGSSCLGVIGIAVSERVVA